MLVGQQLSHGLFVTEQGWVGHPLPALGREGWEAEVGGENIHIQ